VKNCSNIVEPPEEKGRRFDYATAIMWRRKLWRSLFVQGQEQGNHITRSAT
jgi:hypothetical protein